MNCEITHEKIVLAAYGELPDEHTHELERHLAGCAECREEREQLLALRTLAAVHPVDARVELQILFDRDDIAVVDLEVGGALAGVAGEHRSRQPEHGVEQHPQRPAVHGAVASQVKAGEARRPLDPAVVGFSGRDGDRQDVAAHRQVHPAPRRRRPFVGVERAQQRGQFVEQVRGLGDDFVGCVDRTGVILQLAHPVDEPAVVRAALCRGFGRVESAAGVRGLFACHQDTVFESRKCNYRRVYSRNASVVALSRGY